jgi:hypothetical protein
VCAEGSGPQTHGVDRAPQRVRQGEHVVAGREATANRLIIGGLVGTASRDASAQRSLAPADGVGRAIQARGEARGGYAAAPCRTQQSVLACGPCAWPPGRYAELAAACRDGIARAPDGDRDLRDGKARPVEAPQRPVLLVGPARRHGPYTARGE